MDPVPESRALMLYDGLCGFCNGSIRWIARRDRRDRFRFAPQQSSLAETVLARHGIDREAMIAGNSVYLVLDYVPSGTAPGFGARKQERILAASDVTVNVLVLLGGLWLYLGRILRIVPKPLRDRVYSWVARNRFRLGGRYETCPLPSPAERAKFLA